MVHQNGIAHYLSRKIHVGHLLLLGSACCLPVYAMAQAPVYQPVVNYQPVILPIINDSAVINDNAVTVTNLDIEPFTNFNPQQRRSFDLLMRHFTQCYQYTTEHHDNAVLNSNVEVTIYEKHNDICGGAPETFPRVASYAIDIYGRIFEYDVVNNNYNLQYKFIEKPVWVYDVTDFKHPTKAVFEKYGIALQQFEKRADNTFVTFYIADTPLLYKANKDNSDVYASLRQQLFNELLTANGNWDFMIRLEDGGEYYIEGSKRKIIDVDSYLN